MPPPCLTFLRAAPWAGAVLEGEALRSRGAGGRRRPALRRSHAERRPAERISACKGMSAAARPSRASRTGSAAASMAASAPGEQMPFLMIEAGGFERGAVRTGPAP